MHGKPASLCVFAPLRDSKKTTSGTPTQARSLYFPLPCAAVIVETDPLFLKSLPKVSSTFAAATAMPGTDTLGRVV